MQLILKVEKPTAQIYFEKNFQNRELEWKDIYTLPRRVTINTNFAYFNIIFHILKKCFTNLEKRYPHFALFA